MSTRVLLNQFSSQPFMVAFISANSPRFRIGNRLAESLSCLLSSWVSLIDLAGMQCHSRVRDNVAAVAA